MSLRFLGLAVALSLAGCPASPVVPGSDSGPASACTTDTECDDGRFCNGDEVCTRDAGSADSRGCAPGAAPCAASDCDEGTDRCTAGCTDPDVDRDGANARACGGTDCDDTDPNRAPGRPEVCDVDDLDEDCDPRTFGVRDLDLDGEADARCCNEDDAGMRTCGRDCDDTRAAVGPTSPEVCNTFDDDCDGAIDEGGTLSFYRDADGDGHGDPADVRTDLCGPTGEYSATTLDDCDDADPLVYPSAREICNREDDDCSSGGGAEPAEDPDGDSHTATSYTGCEAIPSSFPRDDCNDGNADVHPGAAYQHAPLCSAGESCVDMGGLWTCGARGPTGYACIARLPKSTRTWDYDCSGGENAETVPSSTSCSDDCGAGGTCAACLVPAMAGCMTAVPSAEEFLVDGPGAPVCGTPATYGTCGGSCADVTCARTDAMLPLRCR